MGEALWWLPSLVVFGTTALVIAGGVVGVRRLGVRRERAALESGRELEVRAKGLIVQADTAVREADREIAFAEAQFGPAAARELRTAFETAGSRLREAILLQQRLDDAEQESAADRRRWSAHIVDLCDSALRTLQAAQSGLAARRRLERGAGTDLAALREDVARIERRRTDAAATLERLVERFAPTAVRSALAAAGRADAALAEALAALAEADRRIAAAEPAAEPLATVADRLERADHDLAVVERTEADLASAEAAADDAASALDADLAAARAERDATEDRDAQAGLGVVIGEASAVLAGRTPGGAQRVEAAPGDVGRPVGSVDPVADRDRLRAARDRLEVARAAARNAQGRLDGARGALGGAIAIAESQVRVAHAAIERGGGRIGGDARARLAEAERQLVIARQEPDPVAALDAARRASARASDAEALAAYDAMGGAAR
ncbi:hypothetical protein J2X63_002336 [Agromyces sp. 3263]|uniref:hypothetical protein n=1 Tax=Agromyces sp. 3263 TaxID=2817750 RepID=UPI00285E482E|nr:hypothetical protein [Agromyces sp. 3263]MDR6906650.1 hypothetical protein [Agromyces sp. 3263]